MMMHSFKSQLRMQQMVIFCKLKRAHYPICRLTSPSGAIPQIRLTIYPICNFETMNTAFCCTIENRSQLRYLGSGLTYSMKWNSW